MPELRTLSDSLVEDRLHDADLRYLRRKRKFKVAEEYLEARITYCKSVLKKHKKTLELWAYTDGTVFYLDRTQMDFQQTQQAALGSFVWRRSESREALFQDCIGPSIYSKAQGIPIRVWGFLDCGRFYLHVLDAGEVMNEEL